MGHAIGLGVLVTAIAFAFGLPVARFCVGTALVLGVGLVAFVMFLVVTNGI